VRFLSLSTVRERLGDGLGELLGERLSDDAEKLSSASPFGLALNPSQRSETARTLSNGDESRA
jgi:hypothetical protein